MRHDASRWTVSIEKAGRQTAMYSAPSGPGVLYAHPLTPSHQDGLPGQDVHLTGFVLDSQRPGKHDRVFVKVRPLPRLDPPGGRPHPCDAHRGILGVHPADELIDQLGLVAGGLDSRRLFDQLGHRWQSYDDRHFLNGQLARC